MTMSNNTVYFKILKEAQIVQDNETGEWGEAYTKINVDNAEVTDFEKFAESSKQYISKTFHIDINHLVQISEDEYNENVEEDEESDNYDEYEEDYKEE
jgi:hypothetical protein